MSAVQAASSDSLPNVKLVVIGAIFHTLSFHEFIHHKTAAIGVDDSGKISFLHDLKDISTTDAEIWINQRYLVDRLILLPSSQFLVPGFVDTHIHAPQYTFTGTGYDMTLLKWLEKYTFPREAEFKSEVIAQENYTKVVRKSMQCGTTTACYFATTHLESSMVLARIIDQLGQRAYVGKVNMDRNSPIFYTETTQESIEATLKFVSAVQNLKSQLITPVLTPRFVPSCTPELMTRLGEISKTMQLPIQSHLSETPSELDWVKELHPDQSSYSAVYDHFGLLSSATIMAHCVHLSETERNLLKERNVGIAHCPSSNFCLNSGVMNLRRLVQEGHTKIGLGTDVAGGYSPSIMDSIRQAIIASKVIHTTSRDSPNSDKIYEPITATEGFYLATLGGARCLGLDRQTGNFVPGKDLDALIVNMTISSGKNLIRDGDTYQKSNNIDIFAHDNQLTMFEKFIYLGDDRNIESVFVAGSQVI